MRRSSSGCRKLSILWLLAPLFFAGERGSAKAGEPGDYIRFVSQGDDGGRLESAVVTFRRPDGARVHLVAAVHVGDRCYYEGLARSFEAYDALLYEMVKPEGVVPRPGERSSNIISVFQRGLKEVLELEYQLDVIDYARPNFVHADMDAETFEKLQAERGENLFTLMLRTIADDLKRQAKGDSSKEIGGFDLLLAFLSRDRARSLKLLLGRQFQDIEAQVAGLEGEKGSVILTERNKVVIETLKRSLEGGRRNIGIFFGGAHMPDLEKRLTRDLGFTREESRWLVAWDLSPPGEKRKGQPPGENTPPVRRVRRV